MGKKTTKAALVQIKTSTMEDTQRFSPVDREAIGGLPRMANVGVDDDVAAVRSRWRSDNYGDDNEDSDKDDGEKVVEVEDYEQKGKAEAGEVAQG